MEVGKNWETTVKIICSNSQVLGFEVDPINSVQFSNHKGYESCRGQILEANQLGELYDGLKENRLNRYSHLLTGFIGSESFLMKVCDVVTDLRAVNSKLIYVCDPVMGDLGKMYVPKELLPIYQERIIPLADVVTPNQFEAELLSGIKIEGDDSARAAMQRLHEMGAGTVVISSTELGDEHVLVGVGSTMNGGEQCCIRLEVERFPVNFTGTGDLFASLLLAWLHRYPDNLQVACEMVQSTMQAVIRRTWDYAQSLCPNGEPPAHSQLELRLVQSKSDIEKPPTTVCTTRLL